MHLHPEVVRRISCAFAVASLSVVAAGRITADPAISRPLPARPARARAVSLPDPVPAGFRKDAPISGAARFPTSVRSALAFGDAATTLALDPGQRVATASFVDSAAGFAYYVFWQDSSFGPAEIDKFRLSDFSLVGTLVLAAGENDILCAAIDPVGGFAYLGTYTSPGSVIKIRLSDFSQAGSLTLEAGESYLNSAVIDPTSGFAYFGTDTLTGSIVKVRLSDFSRVGEIALPLGEGNLRKALIDSAGGFAYFITTGGTVHRISLSSFSLSGSWAGFSQVAAIAPDGKHAYFILNDWNTALKVRLSDFAVVASIRSETFPVFEEFVDVVTDQGGRYVYILGDGNPSVIRVRPSDFARLDTLLLPDDPGFPRAPIVDDATGSLVFEVDFSPPKIVGVSLTNFVRAGAIELRRAEAVYSSVLDSAGGYLYLGTYTVPGTIIKVRLSDFKRVGTLTLAPGEDGVTAAALDRTSGFAYFGTYTDPGIVVKVRLSDFTRVGAVSLGAGESYLVTATIDEIAGFGYFGTDTYYLPPYAPGLLTKVLLTDLSRIGSLDMTNGGGVLESAAPYPFNGHAYVGAFSLASYSETLTKIRLVDFSLAGALQLPGGVGNASAVAIDSASETAFVGLSSLGSSVAKVRLSDFSLAGTLRLPSDSSFISTALTDSSGGFAFFGTYGSSLYPSRVYRVKGTDLTFAGSYALTQKGITTATLDATSGFGYFATTGSYPVALRLDLRTVGGATARVSGGGTTCPGSRLQVMAHLTGLPPWSVTWSDGATYSGLTTSPHIRFVSPTATTVYKVTALSDVNGPGASSDAASVVVLESGSPPTISAPTAAFPGARGLIASVLVHPGHDYYWSVGNGTLTSFASLDHVTFTAGTSGVTQVSAMEGAPCWSAWTTIDIPIVTVTPPLTFNALSPCRLFDTRSSAPPTGASPALAPNVERVFAVSGLCGIPPTATALSVNVTVTQPAAAGSLTLYAGNEPSPAYATTVSFGAGQTRAANSIVRLGSDGSGTLGVKHDSPGTVHFILDVNGYFE